MKEEIPVLALIRNKKWKLKQSLSKKEKIVLTRDSMENL